MQNQMSKRDLAFRGAIVLPASKQEAKETVINVSYYIALAATTGIVDLVYESGGCTLANDWSSTAATFHEYMVDGFKVTYVPEIFYTSGVIWPTFYWVLDRANAATLGSRAIACNHESVQAISSHKRTVMEIKRNGVEESVWTDIVTPFSWGFIKVVGLIGTGMNTNQAFGSVLVTYRVRLRGKS